MELTVGLLRLHQVTVEVRMPLILLFQQYYLKVCKCIEIKYR